MLIRNLIYILQGENYDWKRFARFAYSNFRWWNLEKRQKIAWTKKARLIYFVSIFLIALDLIAAYFFGGFFLLFIVLIILFLPIYIIAALFLISPIDKYLKNKKAKKAKAILKSLEKLKVIGITGSYGKTSAKEILATILEGEFKVIKTPENVNTDIGIADFILANQEKLKQSDVFIVEMGAYKKGEIEKICAMAPPEYSILTGINESHLERFGSLEKIIQTKFELPLNTSKLAVLNSEDENIKNNYAKILAKNYELVDERQARDVSLDGFSGISFRYKNMKFKTKLLARHNIVLILLCARIAKELGMSLEKISEQVEKIDYTKHRLEPIYNPNTKVLVIDDSYNANYNGIISGLEVLSRAKGRKIVLTPGLVELGKKSREIHAKIGAEYALKSDLVILIKNSASEHIIKGLEKNNFRDYKIYESAKEAHDDLVNILKPGDTIIFQNDWPDFYS